MPALVRSSATESAWGAPELATWPFVLNPYGDGAYVDRAGFDAALAAGAEAEGAVVLRDHRVTRCEPVGPRSWRLTTRDTEITSAAVICATGRGAGLSRELGARWRAEDQLVGVAVEYANHDPSGTASTLIEAVPDGWWYSAPLPSARRIVVFMTDSDICHREGYTDPARWAEAIARSRHTRERVDGLPACTRPRVVSAVSHRLIRPRTRGRWLATGDAAMSVDPLTGRGILHALLAGEAAGTATAHLLLGDDRPAAAYENWLDKRFTEYLTQRTATYAREQRWPDAPFWRRRAAARRQLATA
jgi:flavin-dependent dehydrogenase